MTPEPSALVEFVGDWALELELVTQAEVPVLGTFVTRTRSELAVRLDVRDGVAWQSQRVCTTRINDGRGLVRTRIPASFLAALPMQSFPVSLLSTEAGWAYAADFGRQVLGWDGVGALPGPTELDRVRDDDHDGHPGLTVLIDAPVAGTGEVYVVQAGQTRVSGRWSGTEFRGGVEVPELAQRVVGASSRLFLHGPDVTPDAAASRFVLRPGAASCATPADG